LGEIDEKLAAEYKRKRDFPSSPKQRGNYMKSVQGVIIKGIRERCTRVKESQKEEQQRYRLLDTTIFSEQKFSEFLRNRKKRIGSIYRKRLQRN